MTDQNSGRRVGHAKARIARFFATEVGLVVLLMFVGGGIFAIGAGGEILTPDDHLLEAMSKVLQLGGALVFMATGPAWAQIIVSLPVRKQLVIFAGMALTTIVFVWVLYVYYPRSHDILYAVGGLIGTFALIAAVVIAIGTGLRMYGGDSDA